MKYRVLVPVLGGAATGVLAVILLAACGSPEETPTATGRPVTTSTATSLPAQSPSVTTTSSLPVPALPPSAVALGSHRISRRLEPGKPFDLDAVEAAREAEVDPPPCAGLIFAVAWAVGGQGADSTLVEIRRQGAASPLEAGPAGSVTVGCAVLRFLAEDPASLEVAYRIGALK